MPIQYDREVDDNGGIVALCVLEGRGVSYFDLRHRPDKRFTITKKEVTHLGLPAIYEGATFWRE